VLPTLACGGVMVLAAQSPCVVARFGQETTFSPKLKVCCIFIKSKTIISAFGTKALKRPFWCCSWFMRMKSSAEHRNALLVKFIHIYAIEA
jgi:hypothetical protein